MKKLIIAASLSFITITVMAQNEKYTKAMEAKVLAMDTTRSIDGLTELANSFERIANAEKKEWLPFYYAALAHVNSGYYMMQNIKENGGKIDAVADKAEVMINGAEALSKNNSEIYVVKKMIATLRMQVDPMSRFAQYGPKATEALATAKKLNPENPRIYLLEGQDKFYTPEQFGGSKTEAKKLFETAMLKFDTFKPESTIHPTWGKGTTQYFIRMANK